MRVLRVDGRRPDRLQFRWRPDTPPLLEVDPGQEIEIQIPDSSCGQLTPASRSADLARVDWERVDGAVGPLAVRDAEPGDRLGVDLLSIRPGSWGWTGVFRNFGLLRGRFDDALTRWSLRKGVALARDGPLAGLTLPLRPMLGVIAVLPSDGEHPMIPPERFGGNMDLPLVTQGSRVELPVQVPGAGLSVGDPHGRQGWGELCGTGIEMPARVRLRCTLRKRAPLPGPRLRSPAVPTAEPAGLTTTGIGPDPRVAALRATEAMIDLLAERGWSPAAAYALCSLVGLLRIAEAVDEPNWTVTVTVSEEFERPPARPRR
ncbi:MAG TPA: acetamidase/formamidase family protein [Thermoplasmata archaeon]|nr:acetamidase/formamidase family protein [Thermoplasmata archaeon]